MRSWPRRRSFLRHSAVILTGGGDSGSGSSQPEYVGKIYSAKDGKTWLKIDSEEMATLAVWEDGTAAQSASRAAASTTGSYVFRQGKYTIYIKDGKDIFSLKLEWTQNGKSYSYEIVADLTSGTTLANFKINGKTVDWAQTTAAPEKPAADSSTSGGSSSGETGGSESGGSSEEEPDYSNVPVPEGFVRVLGVSIKGTETWTPESKVFVSNRKLKITSFFMSDHEVTRAEYKAVIGKEDPGYTKAHDKDGKELAGDVAGNNPTTGIKWYAAIVYCNKLSRKESLEPCYTINNSTNPDDWGDLPISSNDTWGSVTCNFEANGYRLPTEAEWEWAARGGEKFMYAGSGDIDKVAWYKKNTNDKGTFDVKTKKSNAYGLYDMSGNVWEWCWDMFSWEIDSTTPISGPSSGFNRCRRGGSWSMNGGGTCEIAERDAYNKYDINSNNGFRVVRTIK